MTASALRRSFPTLRYAAAPILWAGRTRRRRWITATVLLATAAAPVLWWSFQLSGLPDVGEPFDIAADRSRKLPDRRNAFVLYARAAEMLRDAEPPHGYDPRFWDGWLSPWSKTDPGIRRMVEEERPALALYRRAADRRDSAPLPDRDAWKVWPALRKFHMMAMLEASRRQERGEMAGAWGWYRAVLRSLHHEARCGGFDHRQVVLLWYDELGRRLSGWAADPRTTLADLRRALDDATACASIAPSDSDELRRAYLRLLPELDEGPRDDAARISTRKWQALFGATDYYLHPDRMQQLYDLWRIWRREPERRRRIIRLVVANWLAYVDAPPGRRPGPDMTSTGPYEFFIFGPEAPASARALSPAELDRWLDTSLEARQKLDEWMGRSGFRINGDWIGNLRAKEDAQHKALLILLAGQLYRRDHGADPPNDEALVGPYLKRPPVAVAEGDEEAMPAGGIPVQ